MSRTRRGPDAFWANLRQPMPLGRKLRLLIQNRFHFPPQPCCGGPGPGHAHEVDATDGLL
jgi:hypothetical protein